MYVERMSQVPTYLSGTIGYLNYINLILVSIKGGTILKLGIRFLQ